MQPSQFGRNVGLRLASCVRSIHTRESEHTRERAPMNVPSFIMDLDEDVLGQLVDQWNVPDYVPFDPNSVQVDVSDDDDDETREAKRDQLLVIKQAQYEALIEATIFENAQALNVFRSTCSKFCDNYRTKAHALQLKLWIQRGPTVAGGRRLRMRTLPSKDLLCRLNTKTSTENRAVHDYVYLDFDNVRLESKELCEYKPEWSSMRDAVFTFSNRLHFELSTSKHDIVRELKRMIGRKIHRDGDGVEDEYHSLFKGYGLTKAPVHEFDIRLVHSDAGTHYGSYNDPGYDTPTDIAYTIGFNLKFKLPGGDTFCAVGKMTPAYTDAFDVDDRNHLAHGVLWRDAMQKKLKEYNALPHVLHLVTYDMICIRPRWVEIERAVKAHVEYEEDVEREIVKEVACKRRRMDDTVVMTRFEKAALRHKAAKYDNACTETANAAKNADWVAQFARGQEKQLRERQLEATVANLTNRAKAAENACNALQARLDQANKKLDERADARFEKDVLEARAEGRGDDIAMYAWAEEFNPNRGC